MLGIDLSALSSAELSRLLEVSRAKGQAEMTAELLRELARRGARAQAATAMAWTPAAFESPAPAQGELDAAASHPGRMAAITVIALAAVTASVGAGWWLTHSPALPPALAAPVIPSAPEPSPAPAPVEAQAAPASVVARPAPAKKVRSAAHAHRKARPHRSHRHPPPPPHRRHGLLHRLTVWLKPTPRE